MPTAEIELGLTAPQQAIFDYEGPARFHAITAGRRFGKTRGAANKCIEWCIDGIGPILWGDTVTTNLTKYVERYFLPTIKDLPHHWRAQDKQLTICGTDIDFRSAERPENWEGFGYRRIILNEAGIILQDRYLYTNAVLPMMADYPDAMLFALGTPKGKLLRDGSEHPFYTLYKAGLSGSPEHRSITFDSYANPLLRKEDIDELKKEIAAMAPDQVAQEIYGQFIDKTEGHLFAFAFDKDKHVRPCEYTPGRPVYISIDFNVDPFCATMWHIWNDQKGEHVHCFHEISITGGTLDEMIKRIRAVVGHITQLEVTGDRGGASRRIGTNSNVSMFDDLARGLRLSSRQLALPANPPHLQSREDYNYVLVHHPDFRISPTCTKFILDHQTVIVDDKGSIAKSDRSKASQQADMLDCFVWDTPVLTHRGEIAISNVKTGDQVWTRKGWQRVIDHWCRGEREVCEYTLSDGRTITCTPNHNFYTNHGWCAIRDVYLDKLQLCSLSSLTTVASVSASTPSRNTTIVQAQKRGIVGHFTGKCGSMFAGLFQRVTKSITRMTTARTMSSPTLSASPSQSTPVTTAESEPKKTLSFSGSFPRPDNLRPRHGTEPQRGRSGIGKTPSTATSGIRHMANESVRCAGSCSWPTLMGNGSVGTTAKAPIADQQAPILSMGSASNAERLTSSTSTSHQSIVAEGASNSDTGVYVMSERWMGKRPVFDITVNHAHEFFANGVLAHNCGRYMVNTYLYRWLKQHRNALSRPR